MKKTLIALITAFSLGACTSIETATVSGNEVATAGGEAVAVVQGTSLGLTAIFHVIDIVQSDLDLVVNKLLVSEAKAMGANRVELVNFKTTPRHGIFALTGFIIGFPNAQAQGIAVR